MKTLYMSFLIIFFIQLGLAIEFEDDTANKLYQEAYNLVLDKNWTEAIEKFEMLLDKYRNSIWEDDARFWMCYALEKENNNLEESFECLDNFAKSYEDSKWYDDAIQNMARLASELEKEGKPEYNLRIKALEEDINDEMTLAAIQALSSRGDERAFESLLRIYDGNTNKRIRKKMVYIIGSFENKASVEKLKDIAANDTDEDIRGEALFWLADDNNTKDVADFIFNRALNDKSLKVQKKAAFSLGDMDDNFGISYLYKIVKVHQNEDIRADAIFWIGENAQSAETIKQLAHFAKNDNSLKIRKKAVFALAESNMQEATNELIQITRTHEDAELRGYALFWLSQDDNSAQAVAAIKDAAYNDPDQKVQEKAVFALHELADERGLDELINIAKNHKSISIRKKAIFWLGESNNERAVEALEDILLTPKN